MYSVVNYLSAVNTESAALDNGLMICLPFGVLSFNIFDYLVDYHFAGCGAGAINPALFRSYVYCLLYFLVYLDTVLPLLVLPSNTKNMSV